MKKTKQVLAFERLEKEMEVLSAVDMRLILGGWAGKIVGGDGSIQDPYLIYVPIYYGNDLPEQLQSAIWNQTEAMNGISSAGIEVDSKYYKVMVAPIEMQSTQEAINMAGSISYAGAVKMDTLGVNSAGQPILGDAGEVLIRIDNSYPINDYYATFGHELGHILGAEHSLSPDSIMYYETDGLSKTYTESDLYSIIQSRISSSGIWE